LFRYLQKFYRRPGKYLRPLWVRYAVFPTQAAFLYLLYWLFAYLSIDRASALGGAIARRLGRHIGVTRHALRNLEHAMPELDERGRRRIVDGMWDNLGRIIGEFPHLIRLKASEAERRDRISVEGEEHFDRARQGGRPVVIAFAHFGNWEAGPLVAINYGIPLTIFVRPLNNHLVDRLVARVRRSLGVALLEKRQEGGDARRALGLLRQGGVLAVMVDQRYTGGLKVPFFGQDAMTSPAAVELAYHLNCALVPMRIERVAGARYRAVVDPAVALPRTGDRKADIAAGVLAINQVIEGWIRARPEQWLWLHKRWRLTLKKPPRKRFAALRPADSAEA
jgi:KDO2-lipid IV(A) lauroyltransferase